MQAVILRVLEAEASARQISETVRAQAAQIIVAARAAAQEITTRSREAQRLETDQKMSQSARDAEQGKLGMLARAAKEIESNINLDEATRQVAVEAGVRCVSSQ